MMRLPESEISLTAERDLTAAETAALRANARERVILGALTGRFRTVSNELGLPVASCILSSRIGVEVLRYFGIDARPEPAGLDVLNAVMLEGISRGLTAEQIVAEYGDDAWAISVDEDERHRLVEPVRVTDSRRPGGWSGHMVVWAPLTVASLPEWGGPVTQSYALIDLSLDQANRPHRRIVLEPSWTATDDGFLRGEPVVAYDDNQGCGIRWWHRPGNLGYRHGRSWQIRTDTAAGGKPLIGRLIREIRDVVAEWEAGGA